AYIEKMVNSERINFVDNYYEILNDDDQVILKLSVLSTSGSIKLDDLRRKLEKEIVDIVVTASSRKNLEINHITATKVRAVSEYVKMKGYDATEVITIGDCIYDIIIHE